MNTIRSSIHTVGQQINVLQRLKQGQVIHLMPIVDKRAPRLGSDRLML